MRSAEVNRKTSETEIRTGINLDQPLAGVFETGHGFLDHMLAQLQRHGRMGLEVRAKGDLETGAHHLVEDVGIVLGQALKKALGDKRGLERYGDAFVPMDESLAHVVIDLSGRPYLGFEPERLGIQGDVNGFTIYHLREFLRGFANHAGATLHVRVISGLEVHHVAEAIMKAFSRALYQATRITRPDLPSTKEEL